MNLIVSFCVILSMLVPRALQGPEGVSLTITAIVQDDHIAGTVSGLTEQGRSLYKVVTFVKTDRWYVHPYADGGEGKSYALIGPKGAWTIESIYRGIPASAVGILLVRREAKIPPQSINIRDIPNEGIVIHQLAGTPDFGKL